MCPRVTDNSTGHSSQTPARSPTLIPFPESNPLDGLERKIRTQPGPFSNAASTKLHQSALLITIINRTSSLITSATPGNHIFNQRLPQFRPPSPTPVFGSTPAFGMRPSLFIGLSLAIGFDVVQANTEKVIFLGPETVNVPTTPPTLQDLRLDVLTPDDWSKRVDLQASFPTKETPSGTATWVLLTNLTKDQRYELRVCWAATQPTAFSLDVFELPVVWDTPELITSLANYAFSRQPDSESSDAEKTPRTVGQEHEASLLFLRVLAAADYYTDNATLMANVEPVRADLILDPFLLNALPRSLLPTVGYIIAVGVMAWFLSRLILVWIQPVLAAEGKAAEKKKI